MRPIAASYDQAPQTLTEALNKFTVPVLKEWASRVQDSLPTRKAELIAAIVSHMREPNLKRTWKLLRPEQQQAIAEAVYSLEPGALDWPKIWAKYDMGPRPINDGVFPFFAPGCQFVPMELVAALKTFVPKPPRAVIKYEQSADRDTLEDAAIYLGEVAAPLEFKAMLRLVEDGKVTVSAKTGKPTAATQRTIGELLVGGDFYPSEWSPWGYDEPIGAIRAFAWPILLQAGGLAHISGNKLALTKDGAKAVEKPAADGLKALFCRWLHHDLIDEFSRIDTIKGQTSRAGRHMTAASRRRSVIGQPLRDLQPGKWLTPEELGRYMLATDHIFDVTTNPWNLYIGELQYGSLGYAGVSIWDIINMRYLRVLLMEYLATMGLLDVAYVYPSDVPSDFYDLWGADDLPYLSRYDGLLYFRLNALGAYILGQTKQFTPGAPVPRSELTYAGDGLITDPEQSLLPADRLYLERFAKRRAPSEWTISLDTLTSAVEAGINPSHIGSFLRTVLGTVPEDIDFLLADLQQGAERITRVGRGVILQARDADLAARLASDKSLSKWIMQAGGNYLVVLPGNEASVRRRLKTLGFVLPADVL